MEPNQSPTPSPAAEPAAAVDTSASGNMDALFDLPSSPTAAPPGPSSAPEAPQAPTAPQAPSAPEAPVPQAPTPAQAQPSPVAAPSPSPTPAQPPAVPQRPVGPSPEQQAQLKAMRESYVGELAKTTYALSEADAQAMISSPEQVLPMLAARLHVNVVEQAMQQIMTTLPRILESQLEYRKEATSLEEQYFTKWPALKGKDEVVLRVIRSYMHANPMANVEQIIAETGPIALQLAGIRPTVPGAPPAPPPQRPFVPSGAGAPAALPSSQPASQGGFADIDRQLFGDTPRGQF